MEMLTWALSQISSTLLSVDLRMHNISSTLADPVLSLLPAIPRLRKLSLFSVATPLHLARFLSPCMYLQSLQLEWLDGLNDAALEEVARVVGGRLSSLRVWNCEELTDCGLIAAIRARPVLDLKFEVGQFSEEIVRALPLGTLVDKYTSRPGVGGGIGGAAEELIAMELEG
jgi:hypothetical protein